MRQRLGLQLAFVQRFAELVGNHLGHEDRNKVGNDKRDVANHFHLQQTTFKLAVDEVLQIPAHVNADKKLS